MADKEYIEREALKAVFEEDGHLSAYVEEMIDSIPAADVLPRDEAIKIGAELAAMHGGTPEKQQLEEAYLKGVEDGMTRRDVRPVVKACWIGEGDGYADGEMVYDVWHCSNCDYTVDEGDNEPPRYNFCPSCGAWMGDRENEKA